MIDRIILLIKCALNIMNFLIKFFQGFRKIFIKDIYQF